MSDPPTKPEPPNAERYVVSDSTIEALAPLLLRNPRGVLVCRDELAGWIGSFDRYSSGKGGADAAHWLSTFNGEAIIVDRKSAVPPTISVPRASVCVCGGIQPGILRRVLGTEHRESGLAARLLLTWPPRKPKRWTDSDIDPAAEAEIKSLVDRLYELEFVLSAKGEKQPEVVELTPEAKAVWTAFYDSHAEEQADLTGDLSAAWSKLEEYVARIALVLHFVRWAAADPTLTDAGLVDATSMEAAVELVDWFKNEARRVYSMLGETTDDTDRRRLVDWIDRKGGTVTVREVQMGCRWLRGPGEAEAAIRDLAQRGFGKWLEQPTTVAGGRPTRSFVLADAPTVNETTDFPGSSQGSVDVDTQSECSDAELDDETSASPDGDWGEV